MEVDEQLYDGVSIGGQVYSKHGLEGMYHTGVP